ncbi:MAG: tetraacyldisaccharide 4'-kinase [candidate division WOR-3 bacterium]
MIWTPGRLIYYGIFEALRKSASPRKLPVPVISVGNLTMGGTGKTPLVIHIARNMPGAAVLSRGYGGRGRGTREVFVDSDPRDVGDEPVMMRIKANCPVFVGRNRVESGQKAIAGGARALILDDGFQYWNIVKDTEILVFSAKELEKGVHLLPWGRWREPLSAVKRADIAIINYKLAPIPEGLPDIGIRAIAMRYRLETDLTGKRVFGFCGLGDNGSFVGALRAAGAEIVGFRGFRDHHPYSVSEIERILADAEQLNAIAITSSKDMVRIPGDLRAGLMELGIMVELHPAGALSFEHDQFVLGNPVSG